MRYVSNQVALLVGLAALSVGFAISTLGLSTPTQAGQAQLAQVPLEIARSDDELFLEFHTSGPAGAATLLEFIQATVDVGGRLYVWSDSTEVLLRHRQVRLSGKKTVRVEVFNSFMETMLSISDLTVTELEAGEVSVFMIDPVPAELATDVGQEAGSIIVEAEEGYLVSLVAAGSGAPVDLFMFAKAVAKASGLNMTWTDDTEALLKDTLVPSALESLVTKEGLESFFAAVMAVTGFDCTVIGTEENSVLKVEPMDVQAVASGRALITATETAGQYMVGPRRGRGPVGMDPYSLVQLTQQLTGKSFTWNRATESLLVRERIRMVGKGRIREDQVYLLVERLLEAFGFDCEEVGDGEVSVIKIEAQ